MEVRWLVHPQKNATHCLDFSNATHCLDGSFLSCFFFCLFCFLALYGDCTASAIGSHTISALTLRFLGSKVFIDLHCQSRFCPDGLDSPVNSVCLWSVWFDPLLCSSVRFSKALSANYCSKFHCNQHISDRALLNRTV